MKNRFTPYRKRSAPKCGTDLFCPCVWKSFLLYTFSGIIQTGNGNGKLFSRRKKTMGDVMVILALALYIPMSMVFVLCRR